MIPAMRRKHHARSADSLVQHYTQVADASPIPILIYTVPKFTGVNMSAAAVARAAAAQLGVPLYRYLGGPSARVLPVPMLTLPSPFCTWSWPLTPSARRSGSLPWNTEISSCLAAV